MIIIKCDYCRKEIEIDLKHRYKDHPVKLYDGRIIYLCDECYSEYQMDSL